MFVQCSTFGTFRWQRNSLVLWIWWQNCPFMGCSNRVWAAVFFRSPGDYYAVEVIRTFLHLLAVRTLCDQPIYKPEVPKLALAISGATLLERNRGHTVTRLLLSVFHSGHSSVLIWRMVLLLATCNTRNIKKLRIIWFSTISSCGCIGQA